MQSIVAWVPRPVRPDMRNSHKLYRFARVSYDELSAHMSRFMKEVTTGMNPLSNHVATTPWFTDKGR